MRLKHEIDSNDDLLSNEKGIFSITSGYERRLQVCI